MSETVARADEVRDDHRVRPVPWVKVTMNRTSFGKIVPLSIAMQCLGAGAVRHVLHIANRVRLPREQFPKQRFSPG